MSIKSISTSSYRDEPDHDYTGKSPHTTRGDGHPSV